MDSIKTIAPFGPLVLSLGFIFHKDYAIPIPLGLRLKKDNFTCLLAYVRNMSNAESNLKCSLPNFVRKVCSPYFSFVLDYNRISELQRTRNTKIASERIKDVVDKQDNIRIGQKGRIIVG